MKKYDCMKYGLCCTFCMITAIAIGCASQKKNQDLTIVPLSGSDSVYLEIKGDLYGIMWNDDEILAKAAERMGKHLSIENNRFKWDIKSGKDVRVSENIFEYITEYWKRNNEKLQTGEYEIFQYKDGSYFVRPIKYPLSNPDSVFLEIKGDLRNPRIIWGEKDTYLKAQERMEKHLSIENNRFKWDVENGKEVRVSENIFEYLISIWKDNNEKLQTGKYEIWQHENGRYFVRPLKPEEKNSIK